MFELMKSAATQSPGDDDESTVGVNPDQYPDPKDREDGNVDALWGNSDIASHGEGATAQHHSNAALEEFMRGREKFLERHFTAYGPSAKNTKDVLSQHFKHGKSGEFEASKPMANGGSKRGPENKPTLLTKTKSLLGRY